ncbi:hypothetical protein ACRS85_15050 [Pluralibacter gergoviae]|uniref:hypothetical protein n=1 Tax=Pluralibacter gergoviae TaxID=61647 RepID=UPI003EE19958
MKILLSKVVCFSFISLYTITTLAWDVAPKTLNITTHWTSEASNTSSANFFSYNDDGSSVVRYSLTPPVEDSTSGNVMKFGSWNYLDGKVVIRADNSPKDRGNTTNDIYNFNIGGVTQMDKNDIKTGTVYIWYGKQAMVTVNWMMYYDPFPKISVSSGVYDLGTCHKSESGKTLTKSVEAVVDIYGNLNGNSYLASRKLTYSNLPAGAFFTENNGDMIASGVAKTLSSSISSPHLAINDEFNAQLNCDQATVGVQNWSAKVTYTIQ